MEAGDGLCHRDIAKRGIHTERPRHLDAVFSDTSSDLAGESEHTGRVVQGLGALYMRTLCPPMTHRDGSPCGCDVYAIGRQPITQCGSKLGVEKKADIRIKIQSYAIHSLGPEWSDGSSTSVPNVILLLTDHFFDDIHAVRVDGRLPIRIFEIPHDSIYVPRRADLFHLPHELSLLQHREDNVEGPVDDERDAESDDIVQVIDLYRCSTDLMVRNRPDETCDARRDPAEERDEGAPVDAIGVPVDRPLVADIEVRDLEVTFLDDVVLAHKLGGAERMSTVL